MGGERGEREHGAGARREGWPTLVFLKTQSDDHKQTRCDRTMDPLGALYAILAEQRQLNAQYLVDDVATSRRAQTGLLLPIKISE